MKKSRYEQRGVSATKKEVHEAIKNMDKGLYPNAFCKILPDIAADDPEFCNIMHADTAGTKTSLAYIYWKETGDLSVWSGIVQDAVVMNVDDMACAGCIQNIVLSSTVGRNKTLIPQEVVTEVIQATQHFVELMGQYGVKLHLAGGETADVGDIVRTIDVGITAFGRLPRNKVIRNEIMDGDVIVGLASFGQSKYEADYNGGMGSNGLTSARHDLLSARYRALYPESYDPNMPDHLAYSGSLSLTDPVSIEGYRDLPLGKLILSPTRTYLPLLRHLFEEHRKHIHGLIHCTGGAQTKVMKFVRQKRVIKDRLFDPPPLFQLIERESQTPRREMYEVFNMGHRMEIYLPEEYAADVIAQASDFDIEARVIGRVESSESNELIISDQLGTYNYLT